MKYQGFIGEFGLDDWYDSLTKTEQALLLHETGPSLTRGSWGRSHTAGTYLSLFGSSVIAKTHPTLAKKVMTKAVEIGSPIDKHFAYNGLIELYYCDRENPESLHKCIETCKANIALFPDFRDAYLAGNLENLRSAVALDINREFAQRYKQAQQHPETVFPLPHIPSFKRLAIIYEAQGNIDDAVAVCELALSYDLDDKTQGGFAGRLSRLRKKANTISYGQRVDNVKKPGTDSVISTQCWAPSANIDFPDWHVSLTFGKSSSTNYPQATALAKMAPIYLEHDNDGQILHQAVYSDKPQEYLQFVKLYELVSSWKGHYVIINGEWWTEKLYLDSIIVTVIVADLLIPNFALVPHI